MVTDQLQGSLRDAFEALDKIRAALKLVDAGFLVGSGEASVKLSYAQIQNLKAAYIANANRFSTFSKQLLDAKELFQ